MSAGVCWIGSDVWGPFVLFGCVEPWVGYWGGVIVSFVSCKGPVTMGVVK